MCRANTTLSVSRHPIIIYPHTHHLVVAIKTSMGVTHANNTLFVCIAIFGTRHIISIRIGIAVTAAAAVVLVVSSVSAVSAASAAVVLAGLTAVVVVVAVVVLVVAPQ